ncbi:hypothetical protein ACIPSA_27795 [Streptomyces sp. NPDC086549]|uniref:hypothetical protein n=1 Tax=Streptomyces sp. NPDC086549 TaxID=3365752 RepID=UPI00381E99BD
MFPMTRALNGEHGGAGNIVTWIVGQLGMSCLTMTMTMTMTMTVLWAPGLRFLWRSGRPLWRCLVTAYAVLFVLFAVTTGVQVYYLGGLYVRLLAAGAVGLDGWLHSRPERLRGLMIGTAVSAALSAVIVLPVLPPADVAWTYGTSPISGETLGRPQPVGTVRQVWTGLPAGQRANAVRRSCTKTGPTKRGHPQPTSDPAENVKSSYCGRFGTARSGAVALRAR